MAGEKSRRSAMDIKRLAGLLQRGAGRLLVIDSRTFSEYNASHVHGAINVCCSKLVKRRLQQDKVSVTELLQPNGKVKTGHWQMSTCKSSMRLVQIQTDSPPHRCFGQLPSAKVVASLCELKVTTSPQPEATSVITSAEGTARMACIVNGSEFLLFLFDSLLTRTVELIAETMTSVHPSGHEVDLGRRQEVVVYDQSSKDAGQLSKDSFVNILLGKLDGTFHRVSLLTAFSCPALFCPAMPCPVISCPAFSCPVLFCPALPCPVITCTTLSCPAMSHHILPCVPLSCLVLSCPALSCHFLHCFVLSCFFSCPAMSRHILPCVPLSCLVLSCHALSCHILPSVLLSCFILSCPALSCHFLHCFVLSCFFSGIPCPVIAYTALSCSAVSCPAMPCPVISYTAFSCSAVSCPALSCNILHCFVLSCFFPVLLCPVLPCLVPSYPALLCPVLPCPALPCPSYSALLCLVLPCPVSPCPVIPALVCPSFSLSCIVLSCSAL
ncbi:hypothetical protein DNTS_025246 [Danionella cerebrum]|uniref:Rhodanese domain-containing protein n=1 Tax=Danionella cerebrum TaxID=2873325 RepID=A0A553RBZ7_9TELE|nr:hypothetical protein DNTS_025246 [Danionella translucida]